MFRSVPVPVLWERICTPMAGSFSGCVSLSARTFRSSSDAAGPLLPEITLAPMSGVAAVAAVSLSDSTLALSSEAVGP